MNEHDPRATRAWVLHPDIKTQRDRRAPERALDEAVALAADLGELEVVGSDVVGLPRAQPGMLFGKGKVAELKAKLLCANVTLDQGAMEEVEALRDFVQKARALRPSTTSPPSAT